MEIEERVREVERQIHMLVLRRKLLLDMWWIIHRWGWLPERRCAVARSFVQDHDEEKGAKREKTRSRSL